MLLQLSGRSPMSCDGNTLWDITRTPPGRLVSFVRLKYVSTSRTWSSELATVTSTLRRTHLHQTQRPPTLSPDHPSLQVFRVQSLLGCRTRSPGSNAESLLLYWTKSVQALVARHPLQRLNLFKSQSNSSHR